MRSSASFPPADPLWDSTLALLRAPYTFIGQRCRHFHSDVFQARVLLEPSLFMRGAEATRLFYNPERFTRQGAAPLFVQKTLFGQGGVQTLDGPEHEHRKQAFLQLLSAQSVQQLADTTAQVWQRHAEQWTRQRTVVLYPAVQQVLTEAVCEWAGVPLQPEELSQRSEELSALFDSAGAVNPMHFWSRLARNRCEEWLCALIQQVRTGQLVPPQHSALALWAHFRNLDGQPLAPRIAAVELLNVLRPTVAVSVFIVHAAHALHHHPSCRRALQKSPDDAYLNAFVQEVRRFYPFFPMVMARVKTEFEWNGYTFPQGRRTYLDLYGTNHDARIWPDPDMFKPERFEQWQACPYHLIPQGGGELEHHRCPGEDVTLALMKVAVDFLACRMHYTVPPQKLELMMHRLPALPESQFCMANVTVTRRFSVNSGYSQTTS